MYHAEFLHAKDFQGRRYRSDNGDMVQHCMHSYHIYPRWETVTDYHAGFIPQDKKAFAGFEGICSFCGDVIMIQSDNVLSQEDYEKFEEERVAEIRKEKSSKPRKEKGKK